MILRLFLFAMMGIGLAGFGIYSWRAAHQPAPPVRQLATASAPAPVMLSVLIAAHDLAPGSFVRPDDLSTVSIAQNAVPPGARRDTSAARGELVGALVLRPIVHEAVLDPTDLLLSGGHGFLAALLTPGMRAFTISHDQSVGDAGLIWPGDRLDLILTQQMQGAIPAGRQISAETVLTNLRVLAIDRQLVQSQAASAKTVAGDSTAAGAAVTVEVSPGDAERLAVALRLGKVAFAVRSTRPGVADKPAMEGPVDGPAPGSTTWAGGVMHSLDQLQPPPPSASVRVFEGQGDREYKF